ncbi:MAG: helix-turn-helix domain-containing protein [Saprospiraceae bacterium]|nr:helix-turn-helix domain-containing protein [Saprospiraceae bacterium]
MQHQSNPQLELAFDYVSNTNKNIFLTGKAGTGKTTFLNTIREKTVKRMVVVAPTGVAAINAGGMTIHSFFQLPFGPYLPESKQDGSRQRKFNREKIWLIQSLDLLVIDEISMVRADMLDGIDDVLRRYKDHYKPFGGVQLLMIGDLHQLPPVVKDEEWELMRTYYPSPYFFHSRALKQTNPVAIELKHIYRQSDRAFIDLLNKVRNNQLDAEVLETLNSRYRANFKPAPEEGYITLTSHNASAQDINVQKLAELEGPTLRHTAVVTGDFPPQSYPTEELLELKPGAQVMFVKNDISREKNYYNGKIGNITSIRGETIYVQCPGEQTEIQVYPVEWRNVKYTLKEQTKEVTEEITGTFTQYPLKLAWAITIHKSQGLTFERAIIDAQAAFAHGQVYVALSRCKSFEGIVLRTKIEFSSVKTDAQVKNYTDEADRNAPDEAHLRQSKMDFQQSLILELFEFRALKRYVEQLNRVLLEHENTLHPDAYRQFQALREQTETQVWAMADKFKPQIRNYFQQPSLPEENEELQARLQKAGAWFSEKLADLLPAAKSIQIITDNKTVEKAALEALENLQKEIFVKNACFVNAKTGFYAHQYLRGKADAEIDFSASKKASAPAAVYSGVPKNTPHPELYVSLKLWRAELSDTLGTEPYEVLPTKSLLELVQVLPGNLQALKKIHGIGAVRSKQFGAEILDIIQKYCLAKGLANIQLSLPEPPPKAPKTDTKLLSFELFKAGKNIAAIAEERGLAISTIETHLANFVGLGELDIFEVVARDKVDTIIQFFLEHRTRSLKEAKEYLGDDYSYGELRMVLTYLDKENGAEWVEITNEKKQSDE